MVDSAPLSGKYISLETFRRSGAGVRTPVWFVHHDGKILIVTGATTGKVKRISSDPRVRLAPCSRTGKIEGSWVSGTAKRLDDAEAQNAQKLRRKKYGILAVMAGLAVLFRGGVVAYSVELD